MLTCTRLEVNKVKNIEYMGKTKNIENREFVRLNNVTVHFRLKTVWSHKDELQIYPL